MRTSLFPVQAKCYVLAVGAACTLISSVAFGDVYRCTQPGGKTVYQDHPCSTGDQKNIDDRRARELEAFQREKERRAKEEEQAQVKAAKRVGKLRDCVNSRDCAGREYMYALRGNYSNIPPMTLAEVLDAFGEPEDVQHIGGDTIHYYTLPTNEGRRSAKIQIIYQLRRVGTVNVY